LVEEGVSELPPSSSEISLPAEIVVIDCSWRKITTSEIFSRLTNGAVLLLVLVQN